MMREFPRKIEGFIEVEFALVVPLLALIIMGIADIGKALIEQINVNSALEAATLYVTRYANEDASLGFDNLYSYSPTTISSSVQAATALSHSGIKANAVSLFVTTACSCPNTNGITCPTTSPGAFSTNPPKCPDNTLSCADSVHTANQTRKSGYICITATHTHNSLFGSRGWSPTLSASVAINIH